MISSSPSLGIKLESFLNNPQLWRPISPVADRPPELRKLLRGQRQILENCRPLINAWMRTHGIECFTVAIQQSPSPQFGSLLEIRIPDREFRHNIARIDSVARQTFPEPEDLPVFEDWLLCAHPFENESHSKNS